MSTAEMSPMSPNNIDNQDASWKRSVREGIANVGDQVSEDGSNTAAKRDEKHWC